GWLTRHHEHLTGVDVHGDDCPCLQPHGFFCGQLQIQIEAEVKIPPLYWLPVIDPLVLKSARIHDPNFSPGFSLQQIVESTLNPRASHLTLELEGAKVVSRQGIPIDRFICRYNEAKSVRSGPAKRIMSSAFSNNLDGTVYRELFN